MPSLLWIRYLSVCASQIFIRLYWGIRTKYRRDIVSESTSSGALNGKVYKKMQFHISWTVQNRDRLLLGSHTALRNSDISKDPNLAILIIKCNDNNVTLFKHLYFTTVAVDSSVTDTEWQKPSLSFTCEKDMALSTTNRMLYLLYSVVTFILFKLLSNVTESSCIRKQIYVLLFPSGGMVEVGTG